MIGAGYVDIVQEADEMWVVVEPHTVVHPRTVMVWIQGRVVDEQLSNADSVHAHPCGARIYERQ